jgi:plasmid stabilization system protein ParE
VLPYRVELLEEAELDARLVYLWIYKDSPLAAGQFAEALESAIAELGKSAHTWDAKHGIRRYYLNKYRVTLIYRLLDDLVKIGAVAHQRRKPGYWKDRSF